MDDSKFIEINKGKFNYSYTSAGDCLVLIHGYGASGYIWDSIVPLIDKSWSVLIPELPGSGISDVQENISMQDMADGIYRILQKEEIKNYAVIGHSMGGYVAMQLAKLFSDNLIGLGLLHSHVFADDDAKKEARNKSAAFILKNGTEAYLKEFTGNLFSKNSDKKLVETHLQKIASTPANGLAAHLQAMAMREDTSTVLKTYQQPVFFGIGAEDSIMPAEVLMKQTSYPAIAQVEIFEHSGHMSMLEEPDLLAQAINKFLKTCKLYPSKLG